jgi:hypothetical protein
LSSYPAIEFAVAPSHTLTGYPMDLFAATSHIRHWGILGRSVRAGRRVVGFCSRNVDAHGAGGAQIGTASITQQAGKPPQTVDSRQSHRKARFPHASRNATVGANCVQTPATGYALIGALTCGLGESRELRSIAFVGTLSIMTRDARRAFLRSGSVLAAAAAVLGSGFDGLARAMRTHCQ